MNNTKAYLAVSLALVALAASAVDEKQSAAKPDAAAKSVAVPNGWAYQPVKAPEVPAVKDKKWVRTPVDAFILAKLEEKGVKPSPEADRATYIRRATLDAWGLLPTPEEVKAFVNDKSPNAYEKLVDRLLASHHFGERQARRWLDLARYADSTGFQNDQTRPNNFRYRDYVINAFNQDKPYDRFVKEQLAGDELYPDSQEAKVATGFLANYPDNYNSRDLIQRKYQIETDVTDAVGEVFLASTIGCARCHNHKSDKVSQKEYFQLQSLFSGLAFDHKASLAKGTEATWDKEYVEKQAKYEAAAKPIRAKIKELLTPFIKAGVKYEKERYLTDSRESLFKSKEQMSALDQWVNWRHSFVVTENNAASNYLKLVAEDKNFSDYNPEHVATYKEYQRLQAELRKLDKTRPEAGSSWYTTALELGLTPAPTFVRFTGIHEKPTEEVQPGLPALWGGDQLKIVPTANSSGRRSALANWLVSANNPTTARVFVNREWAKLFNVGIVSTVQDFGRAGQKPSNPELLDYLASSFVKNGWSVKKLQREILLSSVYRQSSAARDEVAKVDPENKLLAVFPRKRLEAEEIRDSLLYASGKLEDKIGGPAVFPPISKVLDGGAADDNGNRAWTVSTDQKDWNRRSIYIFSRRSLPYPLLQTFDPANPNTPHHKRNVTTTPLQAMALFNSDLTLDWSKALAGRIINEAGADESAQLSRLYQVLFSREPSSTEKTALKDFLNNEEKVVAKKASEGKFQVAVPTGLKQGVVVNPVRASAFVDLVQVVANSNDFAYRF